MKSRSIVILSILALLFTTSSLCAASGKTHAKLNRHAKDPVSWSLFPASGLPAKTSVGSTYAVSYTLTNNIPFAVPLTVSGLYNGGKFSVITTCNTTLQPNQSCKVHLEFQPIHAGLHNAQIVMAYHHNRVPLPQLNSTATNIVTHDNVTGHVTLALPPVTYVGVTYPMTFTFINNSPVTVSTTAVNASGFTPTSNTCSSSIPAQSKCAVSGTFTPASAGQNVFGVTYVYATGSVPLSTETNSQNNIGPCHQLEADVTLPLPTTTYIYSDNVTQFTFTNACTSNSETLGAVTVSSDDTSGNPPIITQGTAAQNLDTCSNQTLAPGASCSVYASIIPNNPAPSANDLSVTANVTYNGGTYRTDATSSEVVNALSASTREMEFVNQCSQPVWYGFEPAGNTDPTPNPSWSAYQLSQQIPGAAPATVSLNTPNYYGGNMFGRTGCDTNPASATYGVCHTANCTSLGNTNGKCTLAATLPFTAFEQNFYSTPDSDGFFDVSIINGFNIPGEFRSLAPYVPAVSGTNNPFPCGNSAGAIIQPNGSGLGVCTWNFSPPNTGSGADCSANTGSGAITATDNPASYYFVEEGADDNCPTTACTGSDVCGIALTPQPSTNPQYLGAPLVRRCGQIQGYWTLTDYIGLSSSGQWGSCNLYSHYGMAVGLDTIKPVSQVTYGYSTRFPNNDPMPLATLADMYGCQPTSQLSCYPSPGAPNKCFNAPQNPYYSLNSGTDPGDAGNINVCGCHNWDDGSVTPAAAVTAQASQCAVANSFWQTVVYDRILWLKEACPTAYSYQFDDTSSSYVCNKPNTLTSYQIAFCPGGKTGLPS